MGGCNPDEWQDYVTDLDEIRGIAACAGLLLAGGSARNAAAISGPRPWSVPADQIHSSSFMTDFMPGYHPRNAPDKTGSRAM